MLISAILAWISVLLALLLVLKFFARVSGCKPLNRFFHKIHIPFGVLLLITSLLHGLLAGNPASASLAELRIGSVLFTWNWGTACFLLIVLLAVTYLLRKQLKRAWMWMHRILTIALILLLVLHVVDTGIQLPSLLTPTADSPVAVTETASPTDSAAASASPAATEAPAASVVTFSGAQLADGVYQGSAQGYSGVTTVSVTVSGGAVTDIEVDSESDSPQYFSRAEEILDDIVSEQSLEVDAISGATYSSAGLLNAVYDALQNAVVSGTLTITEIDLSSVHGHGRH